MYDSLTCVVSNDWKLAARDHKEFWSTLLLQNSTTAGVGVDTNTTTGQYGAYSACSQFQQVSWCINQIYQTQTNLGKTPNCNNLTSGGQIQTPASPNPQCNSLLAAAGPLGNQTVAAFLGSTSSVSSTITASTSVRAQGHRKASPSPGAIGGITVAVAIAALIAAGVGFFCWKKRNGNTIRRGLSPEGLEVDTGKPNTPNAELCGEGPKPELWTNRNTTELPASSALRIPGSADRGSYISVANPESEAAAELDSTPHCSPNLSGSPHLSPNTSPYQGSISPITPRLSIAVSSRPLTTEIDAAFAVSHEYRDTSPPAPAQAS